MADGDGAVAVDPGSPAQAPAAAPQEPVAVPSPAAPGVPPALASVDWAGHIPAEYAKEKLWEPLKGKDLGTVLKNYAEGQKARGSAIALPKADAKPEEVAAWKKETLGKLTAAGLLEGPPDKPDAYQIERPPLAAEFGWDDAREGSFRDAAHAMGLSNAQVQGLINWQAEDLTRAVQVKQGELETATGALLDEWGANFDAKLGRAEQVTNTYFDAETKAMLKKTGMNNVPGFIKGLVAVGSRMAEHGDLPGTVEGQPSTQDIKTRIEENRAAAAKSLNPAERVRLAEELHGLYQQLEGDNNRVHTKIG